MTGLTITFWHVLALMALVWLSVLSGVFIGAIFVFRTKREPHESLWQFGQPKGDAFNLDDGTDHAGVLPRQGTDIPGDDANNAKRRAITEKMNKTFLGKIFGDMAEVPTTPIEETGDDDRSRAEH